MTRADGYRDGRPHRDDENELMARLLERDADGQERVDAALDARDRDLPLFFFLGAVSPVSFAASAWAYRPAPADRSASRDPFPSSARGSDPGRDLTPPRRDRPPFSEVGRSPGGAEASVTTHTESESM